MNLKTFTPENTPSLRGSTKQPLIGVSQKSGVFRINMVAKDLMKLKNGQHVFFHQDEDNAADWYLEVVKSGGFDLREKENLTPGGLYLQSAAIAQKIFQSVECTDKSGHILIAKEPVVQDKKTLWPLITAKLTGNF